MSAKPAAANTPKIVWHAFRLNVFLLLVAMVAPRIFIRDDGPAEETEGAAVLFAIPMGLIFAVGVAAATRAYLLASREGLRMKWTAFLPLLVFAAGIALTLGLVFAQIL